MIEINTILKKQPILLFDGECGLCNSFIRFFLKHEKKSQMSFVHLKSDLGIKIKTYFELGDKIDSIILIRNHEAFIKTCAVLRLTFYLKGLWPLLISLLIIPPFLRNFIYDQIAKRRRKWFKNSEICSFTNENEKNRFLS